MTRLERITSHANPLVKDVRKAVARNGPTQDGWCVAEGFHLLEEALRSGCEITAVFVTEAALSKLPEAGGIRILEVPEKLFGSFSATETSQGVLALVRLPEWRECDLLPVQSGLVMVLDGVQDPGNVGTIVRAAEAFGASGIVFGPGSARPQNPKTLRSSAGSLFRVPFLEAAQWRPSSIPMFAAVPFSPGVVPADRADLTGPCAIVLGSEGRGISTSYEDLTPIGIPTTGVESLNVAVAGSILLYEAQRQRGGVRKGDERR